MTYRALSDRLAELAVDITLAAQEAECTDSEICRQLHEHAQAIQQLSEVAAGNLRRDPLPPGQARVLAFVRQFILEHKMPPTRAQIADGLGFECSSPVQDHLKALERKGHIEILPGQARGIRLVTARPVLKLKDPRPEPVGS